jgi:nucleotide-binding universal stress UspA family protein
MIVAITADTAAASAIHVTYALARECGAVPTVLRVVHEDLVLEASATGAMAGVPETALDPAYRTTQLTALQGQVQNVLGELPPWHYDIEVGATVPTLISRTHALQAELVILGLPQHNFFRRAFVRDTVQGVIEGTKAAVLALRPEMNGRPTSILVAMDFSVSSLRAAHLACQLVASGGRVILVYVQPMVAPERSLGVTRRRTDGTTALDTAFTSLIDELTSQKTITVTSVIEHGNSIHGVKEVAQRMQPDVIALGAHHHSAVDWFFGDSVSTSLVSDRQWSLLLVPE